MDAATRSAADAAGRTETARDLEGVGSRCRMKRRGGRERGERQRAGGGPMAAERPTAPHGSTKREAGERTRRRGGASAASEPPAAAAAVEEQS